MTSVVVGVDGGNSKTEVSVADVNGRVLSLVRGPGSSPDKLGAEGALEVIAALVTRAMEDAGRDQGSVVGIATLLAGLDLPEDAPAFQRRLARWYPSSSVVADNDTLAVLLAGTHGEPGAAVVCGAGVNAVGLSASGERTSFLSLGQLSGDWGGGLALGREVLWNAVRGEDGRGAATELTERALARFERATVREVVLALHRGEIPGERLVDLVPDLLAADAGGDDVAGLLVDRLAKELATMAELMLQRSGLDGVPAPVFLAGGVLAHKNSRVAVAVTQHLAATCPTATVSQLACRPVAGALIAALQAADAGDKTLSDRLISCPILSADAPSPSDPLECS